MTQDHFQKQSERFTPVQCQTVFIQNFESLLNSVRLFNNLHDNTT